MPIPTWSVGQVLAAADVNNWFVALNVVKPTDQSVTSSTALVNDTALVLPVAASVTYLFTGYLDYEGGTLGASDLKINFTAPAGAVPRFQVQGVGTGGGAISGTTWTSGNSIALGSAGAGNLQAASFVGVIVMAGTAGNFQLQWAQNTSSGTSTKVHSSSWLNLLRIA